MKIAMVSEHASPLAVVGGTDAGGQNVHVAALASALARTGAQVTVHTRRDDPALARRVPLAPGVVVDHVAAGPAAPIPKDELPGYMGAFAADLARQWRRQRPDVVHAHFWMSGMAALAAARPLAIPVVQTFHALGVVKRRHQGDADTSPPRRLAEERSVIARADRIVATCSDERGELTRLGADPRRVQVVPCGVDLGSFQPNGPIKTRTPGRARLVVVGRLVERKGVGNVITAVAGLPGVELLIAGGPSLDHLEADPHAQRLRRMIDGLGVADRVHLLGRVERGDLPALLRSADAVVCAPWYEPFGMVPLEAMACGVPVVGTAVGGLLDSVVPGVTGLLVPPRSPAVLGDAIEWLLARPEELAAMGLAGARRARSTYGWDRVAAETLAVYRELAAAPALALVAL